MVFGAPIFLFAFAGLAIPLLIHLWSKNTKQRIAFGSISFLQETDTKSTRNFFPSEILLLILRLLLLACLVFIMAEPKIKSNTGKNVAYLLDPRDQALKQEVAASLPEEAQKYWLSTHHQALEDTPLPPTEMWTSLASFAEFDSLVVYSSQTLAGFQADAPDLLPGMNWIKLPAAAHENATISVAKGDSAATVEFQTREEATSFQIEKALNASAQPILIRIYVHASADYAKTGKLAKAAISAMNQLSWVTFQPLDFDTESRLTEEDWVIWLDDDEPEMRKNLVYLQPQLQLFSEQSRHVYSLSDNASLDEMIKEDFPAQLEAALLESMDLSYPDLRQMPLSQLQLPETKSTSTLTTRSIADWFWIAFLILLALERLFSHLKMTTKHG